MTHDDDKTPFANLERRRGMGRGLDDPPLPAVQTTRSTMTDDEPIAKIHDTIADAGTVVLSTVGRDGSLHGRPMIPRAGGDADEIWFATRTPTSKAAEIERDGRALVTYQADATVLVLSGEARIVRDPAEIERGWDESWDRWFPQGIDTPDIALMEFRAERAELWDASGTSLVELAWDAVRAWVDDRTPSTEELIEHTQVSL